MATDLIIDNLLNGFFHILAAPFENPEIWWYLFPILALWITLEFYFGFYKSENLGWNTALGNAFSFAWVSLEGMRVLFEKGLELFWLRFSVLTLAISYSILIIYLVFTHKIKDKYAYLAASPTFIYYLSSISILWMHESLIIDLWVLIDLVILFIIISIIFILIKKLLPQKEEKNSSDDDHQYDKVGFDNLDSGVPANNSPSLDNNTDSKDSGSPMDFMNFK